MMSTIRTMVMGLALLLAVITGVPAMFAQATVTGPVGPSPYDVVRGWHKPFA